MREDMRGAKASRIEGDTYGETKEGPYGPSFARFYTPLEGGNDLRVRWCLPRRPTRARPAWPGLRESAAFEPPFPGSTSVHRAAWSVT